MIADYFVLASAKNNRHARALGSELVRTMKRNGRLCRHNAGMDGESKWVLLDFDEVVIHIFQEEARAFYDLEGLWADVPRVEFTPEDRPATEAEPLQEGASVWEHLPETSFPDSGGVI